MADPVGRMGAQDGEAVARKAGVFPIDFKGKRFVMLMAKAIVSEARFRANKIANWVHVCRVSSTHPEVCRIDKLNFFIGRDEDGLLRGGDLPWQYMQGVCDDQISREDKRRQFGRTLAKLPSHVSYVFKADPTIRDREIVREAFRRAGFQNETRTTLIYKGHPGQDQLAWMKPDARTKIRKGRRELDFVDMGVDEFFEHYRRHLGDRQSYFFLNIDQALMNEAVNGDPSVAEIIAVRRKDDDSGGQNPVEAAAIISKGAGGYCKLLRLTFRRCAGHDDGPPAHQQALKVLIVEAMQRASERGLALDVDGCTPGGRTLYSRFGGFEEVVHDEFTRITPAEAMLRLRQRVNELASGQRSQNGDLY